MYKALIIDDEELIRKSLIKRLQKGNFKFESIMQCSSAEEGYQCILENHPEIVITDIRMDAMTGIELIEKCKGLVPAPRFIVLSGHAEFEYAHQALNNGAEGYLLKPIANDTLFALVSRTIQSLDEQKTINSLQEEKSQLQLSQLFQNCMDSSISQEEHDKLLHLLGGDKSYFMICLVHITRINTNLFRDASALYDQLCDIQNCAAGIKLKRFASLSRSDNILLFYSDNQSLLAGPILEQLKATIHSLNADGNIITTGISDIAGELNSTLLLTSRRNLYSRFSDGNGKVYTSATKVNVGGIINAQEFKKLENDVRFQNTEKIEKFLQEYLENGEHIPYGIELLVYQIYHLLVRLGYKVNENSVQLFLESRKWLLCENKSEIVALIMDEIALSFTAPAGSGSSAELLTNAKDYLETNYSKPLTLKEIANHFHLNSRYFSLIFKKKFNQTPIEYLLQIRMEEAKRLLRQTNTPASEIAVIIGYDDPRYFYKSFKKYSGITATEYRNENRD